MNSVDVCVCTFKRPKQLTQLLTALPAQAGAANVNLRIVVVDNDCAGSAREIVRKCQVETSTPIEYQIESEQNIALARNRAVGATKSAYIALIDDDEMPCEDWLKNLLRVLMETECDGVLGPVRPRYEMRPPKWVIAGKFHERTEHSTYKMLKWDECRTGNALIRRNVFESEGIAFRRDYGSGGEDREFFARKIALGFRFLWCAEAPVFELIPPHRCSASFMLRRALLRGQVSYTTTKNKRRSVLRALSAACVYFGAMPLAILVGRHAFMRTAVCLCDHIGVVAEAVGVRLVKDRYLS